MIRLSANVLKLNGVEICQLIRNPKTGAPDFEESLWDGFALRPLKDSLQRIHPQANASLRLDVDPNLPYSTLNPILRSALQSGFDSVAFEIDPGSWSLVLLEDLEDNKYDSPIPFSVFEGNKYVELTPDSILTFSHPMDFWHRYDFLFDGIQPDQHRKPKPSTPSKESKLRGIRHAYPRTQWSDSLLAKQMVENLIAQAPITKKVVLFADLRLPVRTILSLISRIRKSDPNLAIKIQAIYI